MEGLNLSKGLQFKLGDDTVTKLTALKELDEMSLKLFETPKMVTNEMMISISRKTIHLTKLLRCLNKINEKRISNEKKAEMIKAAISQEIGDDLDGFIAGLEESVNNAYEKLDLNDISKKIDADISETGTILENKAKNIANEINTETKSIAQSTERRIEEDIDLLKQQKKDLFEERAKLEKDIQAVDERYNKALTVYKEKQSFFANFREARKEKDPETGKKKGLFASLKAAFSTTKDSRVQEEDEKRKEELNKIADERIRIENAIADIDKKIVALSDQKKNVNKDILREHSMIAEAIKAHLDKAKSLKVEFNDKQVLLNQREAEIAKFTAKERLDGKNEDLTFAINETQAEIDRLRAEMADTHVNVITEKRMGRATVENHLSEGDKLIEELKEKADNAKDDAEKLDIGRQIYEIEEEQRDTMAPIVDAEYEAVYGKKMGEKEVEVVESEAVKEEAQPTKRVISQEEFENNKDGWIYYLDLRLEDLRASVQSATIEERKKIISEIEKIEQKKAAYKTAQSQEEMEEMHDNFKRQEERPRRRRRQNIEQER